MTEITRGAKHRLGHVPFLEEVAASRESDPSGLAIRAGLLVVRLVDAWMEDGALVASAEARTARAVRAAIEAIPAGFSTRDILMNVLDAVQASSARDVRAVGPRLMAYGRALDLDAQWKLAVDVYDTILEHVHLDDDSETAINAQLRRGSCLRDLGRLTEASVCYEMAAEQARRYGEVRGGLRARIGVARIAVSRGNFPAADAILIETIRLADEHSLPDVRSLAVHDRAHVAFERGEYEVSVRHAYAALRDSVLEPQRDRILNDLAGAFTMLGVDSAVRDIYLILAATAREKAQRWICTINLMALAAADGAELQFLEYQQELTKAPLPPWIRTQFELHVGWGYQLLGELGAAREAFARAFATASEHGLNQFVFQAEAALTGSAGAPRRGTSTPASKMGAEIAQIAAELRALRELAVSPVE